MIFTSLDYAVFVLVVFSVYWCLTKQAHRNGLLLLGSYVFYGYVHPWFCLLIAGTTLANYLAGLAMLRFPEQKKKWLVIGVAVTLGHLGFFKYFGFFAENIVFIAKSAGVHLTGLEIEIFLPVGISFYSFQALGYTVDVYRGNLAPRRNVVDFAVFVSFFPQLVAGPIERANRLLKQFEEKRTWQWNRFLSAWPLLITGYLKKLVIADNVAVYADKVFALQDPSLLLLLAGSLAFALQIYSDFSAYTDIARGSARLFGLELMRNFNAPYLAVSPSDFWRRWHISFSTWIRDYLYIPLGGSKHSTLSKQGIILIVALGLSGLWHGPAWHFVFWGVYHALLILIYRSLGKTGKWQPTTRTGQWSARAVTFALVTFGWAIFRAPSLGWLTDALVAKTTAGVSGDSLIVSVVILVWTGLYAAPFLAMKFIDEEAPSSPTVRAVILGLFIVSIAVFMPEEQQDFIYFQF